MMFPEEDYLQLSGIQHYCYCPRQWGLIHIAQVWSDDARTISGNIMHRTADDPFSDITKGEVRIVRAMPVSSSILGLSGKCDVVEFQLSEDGCCIEGCEGRFSIVPVEYKAGRQKRGDWDAVQLCAQSMALEEMMGATISHGFIYYGTERRRQRVEFSEDLRKRTVQVSLEMHRLFDECIVPAAEYVEAKCRGCSLLDECMPVRSSWKSIDDYIIRMKMNL